MRFSTVIPATRSSIPAAINTGIDSRIIVRNSSSLLRSPHATDNAARTPRTHAIDGVRMSNPASSAATTSEGRVTTSPATVTIGATTLSRSQPNRTAPAVVARVIASTTKAAIRHPSAEITTKSERLIVGETLKASAMPFAVMASATPSARLNATEATAFCAITESRRLDSRNVPAWMAVPSRLPSAPKMLPFTAMAAGTSSSKPGNFSRVSVMEARIRPATRLARAAITSAAKALRTASRSRTQRVAARISAWGTRPRAAMQQVCSVKRGFGTILRVASSRLATVQA